MYNYRPAIKYNACSPGVTGKFTLLLLIVFAACSAVFAQAVDISVDLPARIELKFVGPQTVSQNPVVGRTNHPAVRQEYLAELSWTRIRSAENMVLMVEIICNDTLEGRTDRSAAYLNNGSDKIIEARIITGSRVSFPVNSNTWQITRMNSPPYGFEAWIGVPVGLVREVVIGYN